MIVGDKRIFAVESHLSQAYTNLGLRALGYFIIHLSDREYGVKAEDATMLAASYGTAKRLLSARGQHSAPFASHPDAGEIAIAYRDAIFAPDQEERSFFGIPHGDFRKLFYNNQLVWAPDGDEAFDDGSYVLLFDDRENVRLIGFKARDEGYAFREGTLSDVSIDAEEFYSIIAAWCDQFEEEWRVAPKITTP